MDEEKFDRVDGDKIIINLHTTYKRTPELESMLADLAIQVMSVCNACQEEIDEKLEEITHPHGINIEKMEVDVKTLKHLVNDAAGLVMDVFKAGFGFEAYARDKKMSKLILDKIEEGRIDNKEGEEE